MQGRDAFVISVEKNKKPITRFGVLKQEGNKLKFYPLHPHYGKMDVFQIDHKMYPLISNNADHEYSYFAPANISQNKLDTTIFKSTLIEWHTHVADPLCKLELIGD